MASRVEVLPSSTLGTAHPVGLVCADPDGRYVVLCQAREDTNGDGVISAGTIDSDAGSDAFRTYFIERGAGERVDAVMGQSGGGRYLALVRSGRLTLFDAARRESVVLDSGKNHSQEAQEAFPVVSFGNAESYAAYVRSTAEKRVAVLHDLTSHQERELPPVPGVLWRAAPSPDEHWVAIYAVSRDTNQDGKLELPELQDMPEPCEMPEGAQWGLDDEGDEPDVWLVPVRGGEPRLAAPFIMTLGDRLLRRAADGALLLETAAGDATEVVPASCGGKVVAAGERTLLVACTSAAAPLPTSARIDCPHDPDDCAGPRFAPVLAFTNGQSVALDLEIPVSASDMREPESERFWLLRGRPKDPSKTAPGPALTVRAATGDEALDEWESLDWFVYDSATSALVALTHQQSLEGQHGSKLLLLTDDRDWSILDVPSGKAQPLSIQTQPAADGSGRTLMQKGHFAFARPYEIDLETGTLLGVHDGFPLAIASDGRMLIEGDRRQPQEPSPAAQYIEQQRAHALLRSSALPEGPLRWLAPAR